MPVFFCHPIAEGEVQQRKQAKRWPNQCREANPQQVQKQVTFLSANVPSKPPKKAGYKQSRKEGIGEYHGHVGKVHAGEAQHRKNKMNAW